VPHDCIQISDAEHYALLDGQASGHEIVPDPDKPGYPMLKKLAPSEPLPVDNSEQEEINALAKKIAEAMMASKIDVSSNPVASE
jgi:hypothetical protein